MNQYIPIGSGFDAMIRYRLARMIGFPWSRRFRRFKSEVQQCSIDGMAE